MPVARSVPLVLLLLGSAHAGPAWAQNPSAGLSMAVIQKLRALLSTSPLLEPTMGVVEQAQYVADARNVLSQVPGASAADVESAADAAAAVETALAGSAVRAELISEPPGIVVSYRRLIDPEAALTQATTNDTIQVPPALYLFIGTDAQSGKADSLKVACATGCRVKFSFAP